MRKQYGGKLDRTTLHILEAGLFLVLLLFFVIFLLLLQYQHGKDYTYSPMVAISASAVPAIFPPKIPVFPAVPELSGDAERLSGEDGSPSETDNPVSPPDSPSFGSPENTAPSSHPDASSTPGTGETLPDSADPESADPNSGLWDADGKEAALRQQSLELLAHMSLEEKVGQLFMVRFPKENAAQTAASYHLGGYILFARDFENRNKEQVISVIQDCQAASQIPMLMGVDEEGGTVTRISRFPQFRSSPFLSPQDLYQQGGFEAIRRDTLEKCSLLKELGLNLNFAPVADVSQDAGDFMYRRSFGQDALLTARYVETVSAAMAEVHMGSVLKHFPGYGDNADTHTGIAYDNRSYETFTSSDFLPFEAGIRAGADVVLVSHNIVSCMDDQSPASLSPQVHKILREDLGFSGVIITDDLYMDGVRHFTSDAQAAVQAVLAGNDLLCCTDYEVQIPAVLKAVENGVISIERIDESVLRILQLKLSLGLWE